MRYVHSLLRTAAIAVLSTPFFALADVALDIQLDPELEIRPFRAGQSIPFVIKNNTPVPQKLTFSAIETKPVFEGCQTVKADSKCILTVTPRDSGTLQITATSSTGRNVGISKPYPIVPMPPLEITLAPKKERPDDQITPPFKPNLPIPFEIKNYTDKEQSPEISASIDAEIDDGCHKVAALSSCTVRVTPKEFGAGTVQVTVTSSTGQSVSVSEPLAQLDVTLAPKKEPQSEDQITPPFKPDLPIAFQVKNYTPRQQLLKISASIDVEIDDSCNKLAPDSSCIVKITPKEFGTLRVTATSSTEQSVDTSEPYPVAFRFATYNISFDRNCASKCRGDEGKKRCSEKCPTGFAVLKDQVFLTRVTQDELIEKFRSGLVMDPNDLAQAKAAIQIRNVAEVIQRTNPDVVVLAEFDNNGIADDNKAITDFMDNYLKESQNGQMPVDYEHRYNVPTNTGKPSGYDLDNDGSTDAPEDAWGYGYYHGQYAFAVFSKYNFDKTKVHTYQNFLWKDLPAENPKIICKEPEKTILPPGKKCGDEWFLPATWTMHPLSSKNHIDLPIKVPAAGSTINIHLLASHPTPPIYDGAARRNYKRNRDEIEFWSKYISGANFIDDGNSSNAIAPDAYFVIAGDLNADPDVGDGDRDMIKGLLMDKKVNAAATTGAFRPTSLGAQEYLNSDDCKNSKKYKKNCNRLDGNTITSVSGLRLDHVIPSANLEVIGSGVFWPAEGEDGRHLVYDKTLGGSGVSKEVSSDHRLVWVDLYIPSK